WLAGPAAAARPWPGQVDAGARPHAPAAPPEPAPASARPGAIIPGPPGGVLDLGALAEVEDRLCRLAATGVDEAARDGGLGPRAATQRHSLTTAASSVAAVLWFDALRAEDRVSVTPRAAPLLAAVHQVLEASRPASVHDAAGQDDDAGQAGDRPGDEADARLPAPAGRSARTLRATGAGLVGPSGTVWGALARRFAGTRFDHIPGGRSICLLEYAELRDAAVWEAVTDERTPYLGELFWVVLVTGAAVGSEADGDPRAGLAGPGGPERAARMFEAAGWQVLTLRYGRRLEALFRRPGGQALRARLGRMRQDEYHELLAAHGPELRRRLAGPGAAGAGVAGLLEPMTDDEIHDALRDLGGHDLALLIDAFDDVAADRPTVLFAHTHDASTRGPDGRESPAARRGSPPVGITSIRPMGAGAVVLPPGGDTPEGTGLAPSAGTRGARLAAHVASYLDRAPRRAPSPPAVPIDLGPAAARAGGSGGAVTSTQAAFGGLLRGLAALAPEVVSVVVTVSTRDADPVVAGWLDPAGPAGGPATAPPAPPPGGQPGGQPAGVLASATGRRHVAGALSPGAFAGALGNLAVAWNRQGLPLLPIGVTDEAVAGRVLPAWAAGCAADGRSVLAVADTGADGPFIGPALALAAAGAAGLPGVTRFEPAFAEDLSWCLLAALGRLGRAGGSSTLLRLSARPVDQRLAAVPAGGDERAGRRAGVLAGGYRLRAGGPAPAPTLVGMGDCLPEVLAAADELTARLGREVGVVVVTSADLLFDALRARDSLADADAGAVSVLDEMFPAHLRGPLVTVTAGDPSQLAFLAGIHGDRLAAVGPAMPSGPAAGTGRRPPVEVAAVVEAALKLSLTTP
ncbi:pyruvate dehydrogenase, partial [Frankia nepalensis]